MLARLGSGAVMATCSAALLFAGDSKAAMYDACGTGSSSNPFSILFTALVEGDKFQCQDKTFTIGDPQALILTNGTHPVGGSLTFEWSVKPPEIFPFENDIFSLNINFVPNQNGPVSGSFDYFIAADVAAGYTLKDVNLDSTVDHGIDGPVTTVTKELLDPITGDTVTLTSLNGLPSDPFRKSLGAPGYSVVDSWTVGDLDTLQNIKNSYRQDFSREPFDEVPGPLPLLGAGAAFGFSRRLRSRLLAAKRV
jgi:hypothetical protein